MTPHSLAVVFVFFLVAAAVLIVVGGIGSVFLYALLVRRLRIEHQDVWLSLGSPSYMPATPYAGSSDYWYGELFNWVWRRDYLSLPDRELVRLACFCRLFYLGVFAGLACVAVAMIIAAAIMLGI
jgi:hypothetical protein